MNGMGVVRHRGYAAREKTARHENDVLTSANHQGGWRTDCKRQWDVSRTLLYETFPPLIDIAARDILRTLSTPPSAPPPPSSRAALIEVFAPSMSEHFYSSIISLQTWCKAASSQTLAGPVTSQGPDTSGPGSGVWNAPVSVAYTEDSSQRFGFDAKNAKPRYQRLATEALKTALGPMPVAAFLDTFLSSEHISLDDMPPSEGAFQRVAKAIKDIQERGERLRESDLYAPLVRALNERGSCPGFTFKITSDHQDESHGESGVDKTGRDMLRESTYDGQRTDKRGRSRPRGYGFCRDLHRG
ncbi:hypothetical protein NUW54_g369 [Trametes sanguinea]|uniref:Uncharacterized protein n=1 Tax=Trametes sanguinea TaxID=158606 RepID=A0ACC1QAQ4_9APHY|nr:hypothetical protein NUW54_g369 [Trametes sanguinea]